MSIKEIILWIVILVVVSVIASIIINPSIYASLKSKAESSINNIFQKTSELQEQDPQIKACLNSFEECKWKADYKYHVSIDLVKYQKFNDSQNASEFNDKWGGQINLNPLKTQVCGGWDCVYASDVDREYPIVLLVLNIKAQGIGERGELVKAERGEPVVVACSSDGQLDNKTKWNLCA